VSRDNPVYHADVPKSAEDLRPITTVFRPGKEGRAFIRFTAWPSPSMFSTRISITDAVRSWLRQFFDARCQVLLVSDHLSQTNKTPNDGYIRHDCTLAAQNRKKHRDTFLREDIGQARRCTGKQVICNGRDMTRICTVRA
jgi:hypothetical protein